MSTSRRVIRVRVVSGACGVWWKPKAMVRAAPAKIAKKMKPIRNNILLSMVCTLFTHSSPPPLPPLGCKCVCAPNRNSVRDRNGVTTLGYGLWLFKNEIHISRNLPHESENNNVNSGIGDDDVCAMHVWAAVVEFKSGPTTSSRRTESSKTIHKIRLCHVFRSALI